MPATLIVVAITIFVQSLSFLDAIQYLSFIRLAINESVETSPSHLVLAPLSPIYLSLCKIVHTET